MGTDIHFFVEAQDEHGIWEFLPDVEFDEVRDYGFFGFLVGLRNYSVVPPLSEVRGLPFDLSTGVRTEYDKWASDAHSCSYLMRDELLGFDYDQSFENRRERIGPDSWSGNTVEIGQGEVVTYREFLPSSFLDDLKMLKEIPARNVRLVFFFDN